MIAMLTTSHRNLSDASNSGRYSDCTLRTITLSFVFNGFLNSRATPAGTKVTDSTMALTRAITTVVAMGWNILPSIPVSAKIGM